MIETEHLGKRYGKFDAVAELDLKVAPGQVLALLGPNGAGKTTTMRMIAGFLTPSSGRAMVCGHDVVREPLKARRALGYLPEGAPSYGRKRGQTEKGSDGKGVRFIFLFFCIPLRLRLKK